MTVFIRRAPVEDNTASECIRTVAATYGCKIYNYTNMMRMCTDTMRTANDTQEYQFMQHKRQLITKMRYFCISLSSTCFKIKIIINT